MNEIVYELGEIVMISTEGLYTPKDECQLLKGDILLIISKDEFVNKNFICLHESGAQTVTINQAHFRRVKKR